MESKEYDFMRNPVVQNEIFFLESKCALYGFSILARSIDELVEQEAAHRTLSGRGQTLLHNATGMRAFPTAGRSMIPIFHGTDPTS